MTFQLRRGFRVLQLIDADPLHYPPTINAARVLAAAGAHVRCVGTVRAHPVMLHLPAGSTVEHWPCGAWTAGHYARAIHWGLGRYQFRRKISRACDEWQPELLIAYDIGAAWAALPVARSGHIRSVFHLHDNPSLVEHSWRSQRSWQWIALRKASASYDAWVVPDALRVDHLAHDWGVERSLSCVANAPPRRSAAATGELRDRLGLDADVPLAIVVGTMGNLEELAAALARTRLGWHVAIVGSGNESALNAMRTRAHAHGTASRIHVIDYTDYDTTCRWLADANLGLAFYPPNAGSVNWRCMGRGSVKLLEYMASGLPSLVSTREAFQSLAAETGALAILDDPSPTGIARQLDELTPGSARARELSEKALSAHASTYHLEAQLFPLLAGLGIAHEPRFHEPQRRSG